MYKKVSTDLNFVDREKQTEKFWEDNDIFRKSMRDREGNEIYMFYDGPPTANGKPHIGHVLTRVIKDMIPRYRTMKGYEVPRTLPSFSIAAMASSEASSAYAKLPSSILYLSKASR